MRNETLLYFGSFNPVHRGHIAVADAVLDATNAEALWMIVSPHNPFKNSSELAPEANRLEMVRLACSTARHKDRITASGVELDLPYPSRTIRTLETLTTQNPDRNFTLLIGSDNVADFPKWSEYETILDRYKVLVYPRPDYPISTPAAPWMSRLHYLENVPLLPQGATTIRAQIARGETPEAELPSTVWNYIKTNRLYGYAG